MALDELYEYFRHYDKSSFQVVACLGNEPSESDVADFEKTIGFRLPEEFREFTKSGLGGLYMEVHEHLWPRHKVYDVGPFWSFLYGLCVFGIAKNIPDWLDIRAQYQKFKTEVTDDLVPFLKLIGDPYMHCFDRSGRIVNWSPEERDRREIIDLSFSQLVMREIHALEQRKERKLRCEDKVKN